jgi:hypothetical protein
MLNDEAVEMLSQIFEKSCPDLAEDYEVHLIAKQIINPESEFVKRTMLDFQLSFLAEKYDACSNLLMACEQLAKAFGEKEFQQELLEIWNGTKFGMTIPDLEYLILKGIKHGGNNKEYEIEDEKYTSSGLNRLLKASKREIYKIFGEIQKKYNLKQPEFDWSNKMKEESNVSFDDLKI